MTAVQQKKDQPLEFACINPSCGNIFPRRSGGRKTCSETCKSAVQRAKKAAAAPKPTATERKVQRRKERLLECPFGYWLISTARRAETVQTYRGVTAEDLHELYEQHNYRKKRYGWVEPSFGNDDYVICHIQPLKPRVGPIGLTTPDNTFVGLAELNSRQGNKLIPLKAGASLPETARRRKWDVTPDMTQETILQLLSGYLGPELDRFLDELDKMPQRTARLKLARRIHKRQSDDSGLYEPLSHRYTLDELSSMKLEELQQLDEIQTGMKIDRGFLQTLSPDSPLGVLYDQLQMKMDSAPAGQYRDNCVFMLKMVKATGLYLAQVGNPIGKARNRFLHLANADWTPFHYLHPDCPWHTPASLLADDLDSLLNGVYDKKARKWLKPGIIPTAQDALQGNEIDREYIENRLLKRLALNSLVPEVQAPDAYSWEANGSSWTGYVDALYASFADTWQSLVEFGLCTEQQIADAHDGVLWSLQTAVEQARQQHMNISYIRWTFRRFPAYLEFPPFEVEPSLPLAA
ncbi:hypothetical protein [Metapseudomonas furukawaii]